MAEWAIDASFHRVRVISVHELACKIWNNVHGLLAENNDLLVTREVIRGLPYIILHLFNGRRNLAMMLFTHEANIYHQGFSREI